MTAALFIFLIGGLFWHKHRINQLEERINHLNDQTNERLYLHAEYMGLLTEKAIEQELYEMYPEWPAVERERMQWIKDNNYWHNGRYWGPRG